MLLKLLSLVSKSLQKSLSKSINFILLSLSVCDFVLNISEGLIFITQFDILYQTNHINGSLDNLLIKLVSCC